MEVDVDPQEEQIEELKQDKNMYWKIIVSLQHKIQSIVKSVEYIAEENDRQGRDLLRWETGEEVKELVEGVELKTPVLTGANPVVFTIKVVKQSSLIYHFTTMKKSHQPLIPMIRNCWIH